MPDIRVTEGGANNRVVEGGASQRVEEGWVAAGAAVTDSLTLIEDMEAGGPTLTNWPTGGPGASNDTDLFYVGLAASSKKIDNETKGYWMNPGITFDLSGTGQHVKFFFACTTPSLLTALNLAIGSVANSAFEEHAIDLSVYPDFAGWVPIWVAVGEGVDTGTPDFSLADEFGVECVMGDVTGNLKNVLCDQIHHGTRPALIWSGAGGDLDDFITSEDTNAWGVLALRDGVYTCYASLQIGDSSETAFDAAGKTIVFPDAIWLPTASTWMGLDFSLAHASTLLDWTGGTVLGGATRKPDLIVTGTSGALDLTGRALTNLRLITLTSGVTADGVVITTSGQVTPAQASMLGAQILESAVAADVGALLYNEAVDPDGELDDMVFTKGAAAHHAIELGSNTPSEITLRGWGVSGFHASDEQNDSVIFNDSGKEITINIIGGTGTFSVKNGASASTILVIDPVTLAVTARDEGGVPIQSARCFVLAGATGPFPYQDSVTITRVTTTASVAHTAHGMLNGNKVLIEGAVQPEYNGIQTISNVTTNAYDYTVAGAPTTPATGTIIATAVIIDELTTAGGLADDIRTYTADQDIDSVRSWMRKASSGDDPKYKTATVAGTIDSAAGLSIQVQMIKDQS